MTVKPTQLLTVENRSTVMSDKDYYEACWALAYQLKFHYGRSAWVTLGLAPPATVAMLKTGEKPPPGAANIVLLDTSDEQGALGYHEDAAGSEIPYADVFCKTALQDAVQPSSVISHEGLETLVDPFVTKPFTVRRGQFLYLVEVCDPVQGSPYDVGAPENRKIGVEVSNFCLPWWWELGGEQGPVDYRGALDKPFRVGKEGYISRSPVDQPEAFESVFGERQRAWPRWASRLPRIHRKETPPGPPSPPRPDSHRPVG